MVVLYHTRVLWALDACSISYSCPLGPGWLFYIILVSSGPLMPVSTEPPDDLSCLTTPGVGCPGDGLLPVPFGGGGGALRAPMPEPRRHWGGSASVRLL